MYVIVELITAVLRNPLSETRRPFSGAFSSRSFPFRGALMSLKAVADMVLLEILFNTISMDFYMYELTRRTGLYTPSQFDCPSHQESQTVCSMQEACPSHDNDQRREVSNV